MYIIFAAVFKNRCFFMKKLTLLWLDDCRDPHTYNYLARFSPIGAEVDVVWVKNFDEFENFILQHGLPDAICFDHDLAEDSYDERTGYDCAKLVVEYCLQHHCDIPPFAIQSSNPVGKEDILHLLDNYHHFFINTPKQS